MKLHDKAGSRDICNLTDFAPFQPISTTIDPFSSSQKGSIGVDRQRSQFSSGSTLVRAWSCNLMPSPVLFIQPNETIIE